MKKMFLDLQASILGLIGKKQGLQEKALSAVNPIDEADRAYLLDGGELADVIAKYTGGRKILPGSIGMVHFDASILWDSKRQGHSLPLDKDMRLSHVVYPVSKKSNTPVRLNDQVIISMGCLEPDSSVRINFMDFAVFPDGSIVLTACENELSTVTPAPRPAPKARALK
jgi:hypothetical protein